MKLLVKLNEEGTTVIMVTHSRSHAEYARRVVNMLDGRVVTENVGQVRGSGQWLGAMSPPACASSFAQGLLAINVIGLAVGLASVVLIALFVRHELGYDSLCPDADRVFRISRDYYAREGSPDRVPASNNAPVAPALLEDFPEIERIARVFGGITLFTGDITF